MEITLARELTSTAKTKELAIVLIKLMFGVISYQFA